MIKNSQKNVLYSNIVVNLDLQSINLRMTADTQPLRLLSEALIRFENAETN